MTHSEASLLAERESLAQVLRSIVDHPNDLTATLQTIIDHAVRLCQTDKGYIYLRDGDVYRHHVDVGATPEIVAFNKANPIRPTRGTATGRAAIERKPVHIPDVDADPEYEYWEAQRLGGFRTLLSVPMLHEHEVIGVINVYRTEVQPFDDDEISLLATFAEQASLAVMTSQLVATVVTQRSELAQYLPQQVADLVSSSEGAEKLEGHRSEVSVVFTDLRGFTAFAATAEPEEVIAVLSQYHEELGRLVTDHEGTLNAFEGDGLMIYFNDPVPMPNHAEQAINMSRAMQARFAPLSEGWQKRGFTLGLGIGIATGYATLGRMGYEGRYHYGPIGTIVNLASRLCDEADPGEILISQQTMAASQDEASPKGEMELKGFSQSVTVFSVESAPN